MTTMNSYAGVVQQGKKRGTVLGYPTLNIPLNEEGVSGIYAAKVTVGSAEYPAAAFANPKRKLLEAHLLDFSGDLYGKEITIELCEKIRESKAFPDDVSLRAAIAEDIAAVRAYFMKQV